MADGSRSFNFPPPQRSRLRPGEIVVDLFAGGGGASEGLKQAIGVDPALAYNHDKLAIGMHAANHPLTLHHREDIWHADPRVDVAGRPIGWFHASPDCTHFSQAKGGQPRSRKTRALSWVVLKWVGQLLRADRLHGTNTAPRIISMENVWQILTWGPLVAKRCCKTGRVITLDLVQAVHPESGKPLFRRGKPVMVNRVADKGERVPVERQALVPHKRYSGRTWRQFVAALRALGYAVEWRKLVASDYGAGTSRERLFLLGRRDGHPIVWPEPTHGTAPGQKPRVTAADCLDFSIPCPSIFTRDRPLADATMRRIAKGVMRHVINSADPFIVPVTHQGGDRVHSVRDPVRTITAANRGELMLAAPELAPFLTEHANASRQRTMAADEPLPTVCAGVKGGHFSVVSPTLVQTGYGERAGQSPRALDLQQPLGTIVAGGVKHAVAAPHLVKFRGDSIGSAATEPVPTITSGAGAARPAGAAHGLGLATAFLEQANGGFYQGAGNDVRDPVSTITASGSQQRLVSADLAQLSPEQEAGALRVAAFLVKYYGSGIAVDLHDPMDTVTTKDRLALVTVHIQGTPYVIVDIGLRMLKPHELFRAQGFPVTYIIDRTADGTVLKITAQVRMCGNSVSPPPFYALIDANLDPVTMSLAEAA
ncbi:DNA methyltransferase [Stenotrophomonas maltophilia]|uniref:DNA cytosine methyltransferase n=1 Tax=Stenotrophomonas maltophilia TaxID=40324 RepID=UPI000F768C82|nr:DNA cytosine methyltransferase [Stenotrophomonas maltophilia]RRU80930.1 DNA methyltransferase [Stenotrophomonas maltophilia]